MLIGKLAKIVNTSIDTIRYYQNEGLITPTHIRDSGYREFDENSIDRMNFILGAKKLGFTLKQIKELLSLKEVTNTSCVNIRNLAKNKLDEVTTKITELKKIETELKQLIVECKNNINDNCPIIKNLDKGNKQ